MSNLILGQAYSYSFEPLFPFVDSLKQTGFRGDTLLFVHAVPAESRERLAAAGIQLREFGYIGREVRNPAYRIWPYLGWLQRLPLSFDVKKAILRPLLNIPWVRMILYYDYLVSVPGRYEYVMLTDVRDVVFQDDPFARLTGPGLQAFLEDASKTIGSCVSNTRWLADIFGAEVAERLASRPISCSGTILGDCASIVRYLRAFIETAFTARSTRLNGGDQGIHNFLIHGPLRDQVTLHRNGESEILTMGYMPREKSFPTDREGRLIDAGGRVFNVLHQYDRHPALAEAIQQRHAVPVQA